MWEYNYSDELYHYGVLGMKWGKRKSKAYQDAKVSYKKAKKKYNKSALKRFGSYLFNEYAETSEYDTKYGTNFEKAQKKANTAYVKKVSSKAKLKSLSNKDKNKYGYNKAEFKAYVKGMKKSGIPYSKTDRDYSGRGTKLYKNIATTKGKKYADRVVTKAGNNKLTMAWVVGASYLGAKYVQYRLNNK